MSLLPAKGAKGTLPWQVDVTIIGADYRFVYSPYYPPHGTTDRQHASKNAGLIMLSGWVASGGVSVYGSQRCKAKWTVLGGLTATMAEVTVQAEHRSNLARSVKWLREPIAGF